jgi:hypothetical protein
MIDHPRQESSFLVYRVYFNEYLLVKDVRNLTMFSRIIVVSPASGGDYVVEVHDSWLSHLFEVNRKRGQARADYSGDGGFAA